MEQTAAPLRTLVVDDDPDHRLLIKLLLDRDDRTEFVAEAANGHDAIAEAKRVQPDLAILDLDMPVMTGIDALPHIVRASPKTRVVVLSGLAREDWGERAVACGAVGYLEKTTLPLRLVDDILQIAGVLGGVQAALAKATQRWDPVPESPRGARRFVVDVLERAEAGDLGEIASLLVSELVTNAVVHARTDLQIAVELLPHAVRVNVFDRSPNVPIAREPAADDTSGRGLVLLDRLASAWGVDHFPNGKSVWFEIVRR
jgi:DNA-binding NarL/FixJ family response regulator